MRGAEDEPRSTGGLWAFYSSKAFGIAMLTLSSLAFAESQGWAMPQDWALGLISAFQSVTRSISNQISILVPIEGWKISKEMSDVIWFAGIVYVIPFLYILSGENTRDAESNTYRFFIFASLAGLIFLAGMPQENGAMSSEWASGYYYSANSSGEPFASDKLLVAAFTLLFIILLGWWQNGFRSALSFASNYVAGALIIWTLYLSGLLEIL